MSWGLVLFCFVLITFWWMICFGCLRLLVCFRWVFMFCVPYLKKDHGLFFQKSARKRITLLGFLLWYMSLSCAVVPTTLDLIYQSRTSERNLWSPNIEFSLWPPSSALTLKKIISIMPPPSSPTPLSSLCLCVYVCLYIDMYVTTFKTPKD